MWCLEVSSTAKTQQKLAIKLEGTDGSTNKQHLLFFLESRTRKSSNLFRDLGNTMYYIRNPLGPSLWVCIGIVQAQSTAAASDVPRVTATEACFEMTPGNFGSVSMALLRQWVKSESPTKESLCYDLVNSSPWMFWCGFWFFSLSGEEALMLLSWKSSADRGRSAWSWDLRSSQCCQI